MNSVKHEELQSSYAPKCPSFIKSTLKVTYESMNQSVNDNAEIASETQGASAATVIFDGEHLVTATTGNIAPFLVIHDQKEPASKPEYIPLLGDLKAKTFQKPIQTEEEIQRLKKAGLNLTADFHAYKEDKEKHTVKIPTSRAIGYKDYDGIIAEPLFTETNIPTLTERYKNNEKDPTINVVIATSEFFDIGKPLDLFKENGSQPDDKKVQTTTDSNKATNPSFKTIAEMAKSNKDQKTSDYSNIPGGKNNPLSTLKVHMVNLNKPKTPFALWGYEAHNGGNKVTEHLENHMPEQYKQAYATKIQAYATKIPKRLYEISYNQHSASHLRDLLENNSSYGRIHKYPQNIKNFTENIENIETFTENIEKFKKNIENLHNKFLREDQVDNALQEDLSKAIELCDKLPEIPDVSQVLESMHTSQTARSKTNHYSKKPRVFSAISDFFTKTTALALRFSKFVLSCFGFCAPKKQSGPVDKNPVIDSIHEELEKYKNSCLSWVDEYKKAYPQTTNEPNEQTTRLTHRSNSSPGHSSDNDSTSDQITHEPEPSSNNYLDQAYQHYSITSGGSYVHDRTNSDKTENELTSDISSVCGSLICPADSEENHEKNNKNQQDQTSSGAAAICPSNGPTFWTESNRQCLFITKNKRRASF